MTSDEIDQQYRREQFALDRIEQAIEHLGSAAKDIGQGFRGSAKTQLNEAIDDASRALEGMEGELDQHLGVGEDE